MKLMTVLLLAGLGAGGGSAERNGSALLELCGKYQGGDPVTPHDVACITYMAGFTDAISSYEASLEVLQAFDTLTHLNLYARLGVLPQERLRRWRGVAIAEDMADLLMALQTEAVANGVARGAAKSSRPLTVDEPISAVQHMVCLPEHGSTNAQVALVIVKFLRDHPERLHEDRTALMVDALSGAFPCRSKK